MKNTKFGLSKDGEFIACLTNPSVNYRPAPNKFLLYKNSSAERDVKEYNSANEGGLFRPPLVQNNTPLNTPLNPLSSDYDYNAQENLDFLVQINHLMD